MVRGGEGPGQRNFSNVVRGVAEEKAFAAQTILSAIDSLGSPSRTRTYDPAINSRVLTYIFQRVRLTMSVNIHFVEKGLPRSCQHGFGGLATTWRLAT